MPDPASAAPTGTAPLDARTLLQVCVDRGLVAADELRVVLGDQFADPAVVDTQRRLLDHGVEEADLAAAIGVACGRPVLAGDARPVAALPEDLALAAGVVAIQATDGGRPVVAIVEDGPDNVAALDAALAGRPYTLHMVTVGRFEQLVAAAYDAADATPTARPPAGDLFELLDAMLGRDGSDILLKAGEPPWVRVDGQLQDLPFAPLRADWLDGQLADLVGPDQWQVLTDTYELDFAFPYGDRRFRFNLGKDATGTMVSARLLSETIPPMDALGLPRAVREFVDLRRGLVLVTGPTGSGKSTTLAALLQHILDNQARHVITLEQPVEYQLRAGRGSVSQREVGRTVASFSGGLRQALRQDPDVILIGEMRDAETIETAVHAADTGHLVFATLHTVDAPQTLARIVSMFPPESQQQVRAKLAYILSGVVAQTLVRRAGRSGRVGAFEVLVGTTAVRANLRNAEGMANIRNEMETGAEQGMQTLETSLARLVAEDQIALADAVAAAQHPAELRAKLTHLVDRRR